MIQLQKHVQYIAMQRTRAVWQLYDTDSDRAEMNDLAKENPEKLEQLKKPINRILSRKHREFF